MAHTRWTGLWAVIGAIVLATPAFGLDYQVRRGDTLAVIAKRFGTTVLAIQRANGLRDDMIFAGEVLKVPTPAPADADSEDPADFVYVVQSGDSLSLIARRQGSTVSAIKRANGLAPGRRGDTIHPGQQLVIPASTSTTVTASASRGRRPVQGWVQRDRMPATQAEVEVLARIVKGECPPGTPWSGKVAVAAVVLNRVRSRRFPNSISGAAHQRLQFSCYNRNNRQRLYYGRIPPFAWEAARAALDGQDPTLGCTYYFNPFLVQPSWARSFEFVKRIGETRSTTHDFYRRPDDAPARDEIITSEVARNSGGLVGRLGVSQ